MGALYAVIAVTVLIVVPALLYSWWCEKKEEKRRQAAREAYQREYVASIISSPVSVGAGVDWKTTSSSLQPVRPAMTTRVSPPAPKQTIVRDDSSPLDYQPTMLSFPSSPSFDPSPSLDPSPSSSCSDSSSSSCDGGSNGTD